MPYPGSQGEPVLFLIHKRLKTYPKQGKQAHFGGGAQQGGALLAFFFFIKQLIDEVFAKADGGAGDLTREEAGYNGIGAGRQQLAGHLLYAAAELGFLGADLPLQAALLALQVFERVDGRPIIFFLR